MTLAVIACFSLPVNAAFSDVAPGSWYEPAVTQLSQAGVFLQESQVWLDYLEARGISWCSWPLCDKNETSAALRPGTSQEGPWGQEELTESGRFVFSRFSQ